MHLRHEVRSEDIDLAISVLLESFIQSQKVSIGKVIKKKFSSYISFREDINSILLQTLSRLFKEQTHYLQIIRKPDDDLMEVTVTTQSFRDASKEMNIYDIEPFLKSETFRAAFELIGDTIRKLRR